MYVFLDVLCLTASPLLFDHFLTWQGKRKWKVGLAQAPSAWSPSAYSIPPTRTLGILENGKKTAKWSVTGCTLSQNGYRPKFTIHVFTFIASEVTFSLHEPYGISHVNIIVCWGCNLNCHEKRQLPISVLLFEIIFKINLHPGRLRWNLQITQGVRKMIFQTSMIMFPANLQGCRSKGTSWSFQTKNTTMLYFGLSTFPCSSGRWGFIGIPPLNHYTSNNPGCWTLAWKVDNPSYPTPPPRKLPWLAERSTMKMYFLLNMGFSIVMLVFRGAELFTKSTACLYLLKCGNFSLKNA